MNKPHRTALLVILLAFLHLLVIFPGFFAPYDAAAQNRDLPFAPPTRIHFLDATGAFHLIPFVYSWKDRLDDSSQYEEDRAQIHRLRLFIMDSPRSIIGGWTSRLHFFGVDPPSQIFLFGTDDFGRDQFSRMLYGGRISLLAGWMAAAIALFAGGTLGVVSGYYGKRLDSLIMRLVELFLALPWLYLLFAVRAVLPLSIKTTDAFLLLVAVVGLAGWARPARLVRGIVLSAKERNFVLASRAMGASNWHILRWHVLPQTYRTMITMAALLVPQFILAEVTLSFLGLGVGEPIPSWGNLLAELQKYNVLTSYWWMYLPAGALVALFLAYHWASEILRDMLAQVSA